MTGEAKQWINFKQVKETANFQMVLDHFGIQGKEHGSEVSILCPFHNEKTPSCKVNLEKKVFQCFGCHESGNILDFVTKLDGGDPANTADLRTGTAKVMDICNIETPRRTQKPSKALKSQKHSAPQKKVKQAEKSKFSASEGHSEPESDSNPVLSFSLKLESEHEFLDSYSVTAEQKHTFGLGYCNKGIMKGRVCFPIHNAGGGLVAYVGRWADGDLPEGMNKYKFPDGFKKSHVLYNLNRVLEDFAEAKHLVLVEGFWSVIRLHSNGIPAVACMGTALSEKQIELLKQTGVKAITILFDGDEAGRRGAETASALLARSFYTRIIDLPEGVSPDEMDERVLAKLGG